jgi:hypothetical protein
MERDYILLDDFLAGPDRQLILDYFESNIDDVPRTANANSFYEGRLIYFEQVKDPRVKSAMSQVLYGCADRLRDFYSEPDPIYPEATCLVKWPVGSSLGDHADNALPDGRPNYVHWRSHSAVFYLNDDYDGGEFYFRRPDGDIEIKPRAGMLVAFRAGLTHVHGVKPVTQGTRVAMAMWFTQQKAKGYPDP